MAIVTLSTQVNSIVSVTTSALDANVNATVFKHRVGNTSTQLEGKKIDDSVNSLELKVIDDNGTPQLQARKVGGEAWVLPKRNDGHIQINSAVAITAVEPGQPELGFTRMVKQNGTPPAIEHGDNPKTYSGEPTNGLVFTDEDELFFKFA